MSYNRAPAEDLAPWVSRVMVAMTAAPDNAQASGLLCNDAAYIRTALDARWTAETEDGPIAVDNRTFLTGQHRHCMRLDYRGPIRVAGFMLRPGAVSAIWGLDDAALVQRLVPLADAGLDEAQPGALYRPDMGGAAWLRAMEDWLRQIIAAKGAPLPDPVSQAFEVSAYAEPNRQLSEVCDEIGTSPRALQRKVGRDFGLTPKQVMRRARVLDLASRLCGVAHEDKEEEIFLRFFDQSHQIREFIAFFGITPQAFRANRNALLTLRLEIRQARRLELLDRLSPGAVRPWMRAEFLPVEMKQASA